MPPAFVFLTHRTLLDQHAVHAEIHDWLNAHGWCREVRYVPSSIRRHEVTATVDPTILLGDEHPSETVSLRVAFEYPDGAPHEYYEIQWIDETRKYSIGWHQDGTHEDLGRCHFQVDDREETIARKPAAYYDSHPLTVLERRLSQVGPILAAIAWEGGSPELTRWPPHDP